MSDQLLRVNSWVQMPGYEAYKDSGYERIGLIPNHWSAKKLKFCTDINRESLPENTPRNYLLRYIDIGSVTYEKGVEKVEKFAFSDAPSRARRIAHKGDTVVSTVRTYLKAIFYVNEKYASCIYSTGFSVLSPKDNINSKFLTDFIKSNAFTNQVDDVAKGMSYPAINSTELSNLYVLEAPIQEQTAIAKFLDQKTTQIDQAIAIKEKQIALLKERKQILIQNAVTRGLDPNVPMKDSGVEWIGEIPEHWGVKRLRFLGVTQNGISAGAEYFGSGHPFVSYGDVYNNRELPRRVKGLANSTEEDWRQYSINDGDVLFTRTSETIEEVGFASVCLESIVNSTFAGFLIRFRPKRGILNNGFSKYYFNSYMLRDYFVKEMNLVTRASLSQELLKGLLVLLPSRDEQEKIYTYLEGETGKVDTAVVMQQKQIKKLKEYKTTLINSAVTGKIKICANAKVMP